MNTASFDELATRCTCFVPSGYTAGECWQSTAVTSRPVNTPRAASGTASARFWVQGSLRGEYVRRSLDLRSWEAASELVRGWEASGEVGVAKPEVPTVAEAVTKFIEDANARHLAGETVRKYKNVLEKRFIGWCESKGFRLLSRSTSARFASSERRGTMARCTQQRTWSGCARSSGSASRRGGSIEIRLRA